jgi:hypothetical protein
MWTFVSESVSSGPDFTDKQTSKNRNEEVIIGDGVAETRSKGKWNPLIT